MLNKKVLYLLLILIFPSLHSAAVVLKNYSPEAFDVYMLKVRGMLNVGARDWIFSRKLNPAPIDTKRGERAQDIKSDLDATEKTLAEELDDLESTKKKQHKKWQRHVEIKTAWWFRNEKKASRLEDEYNLKSTGVGYGNTWANKYLKKYNFHQDAAVAAAKKRDAAKKRINELNFDKTQLSVRYGAKEFFGATKEYSTTTTSALGLPRM